MRRRRSGSRSRDGLGGRQGQGRPDVLCATRGVSTEGVGRKKAPRRQEPPRRPPAQAELALPPTGPPRAHVPSPARGSDIWAAIDRRAPDIRPGVRPMIRSGIGSVSRPHVWPVIRSGIRSDIWPGIRPHVWPGVWSAIWSYIRSSVGPDIRHVIWPGVRSAIWSYIRSSVGPDIRPGPIAVAPGLNVGSPGHLLRRPLLRFGIDLCLQIGGTEDQEGSQSENIRAKHLKLLNDSFCLGRSPRSATKTIHIAKGSLGGRIGRYLDQVSGSGSV